MLSTDFIVNDNMSLASPLVIKHQAVNSFGVFRGEILSLNVQKKPLIMTQKLSIDLKKHAIGVGILTREQRCMNDGLPTSFSCFLPLEHTLLSWKAHTGTRRDTSPVRLDGFNAQHACVCACTCANEEEGERGSAQ